MQREWVLSMLLICSLYTAQPHDTVPVGPPRALNLPNLVFKGPWKLLPIANRWEQRNKPVSMPLSFARLKEELQRAFPISMWKIPAGLQKSSSADTENIFEVCFQYMNWTRGSSFWECVCQIALCWDDMIRYLTLVIKKMLSLVLSFPVPWNLWVKG